MAWTAGGIFGLTCLLIFLPIFLISLFIFWRRRHKYPIKARSPFLVVVSDLVLLCYLLLLCLQRIIHDYYPCIVNIWAGYVGTVVLFNTYLWRGWTLYFTFHLTQQKLMQLDEADAPYFIRHRHYVSTSFLMKVMITITILLLLPAAILTATHPTLLTQYGDGCNKVWGDTLLAIYVAIYVCIFCYLAWHLRGVADNFKIKTELKITGVTGIVAVIPWFIFNNVFEHTNSTVFPFSTLFLILCIVTAFVTSTIWPLYTSFVDKDAMRYETVETNTAYHTLSGLLQSTSGVEAFMQFLTKEFSVENILFYFDVEQFRTLKKSLPVNKESVLQCMGHERHIYAKYVQMNAPFQVILPAGMVEEVERALVTSMRQMQEGKVNGTSQIRGENGYVSENGKEHSNGIEMSKASENDSVVMDDTSVTVHSSIHGKHKLMVPFHTSTLSSYDLTHTQSPPTLFDAAQKYIYELMENDTWPRFIRSEIYERYVENVKKEAHQKKVLQEMELV